MACETMPSFATFRSVIIPDANRLEVKSLELHEMPGPTVLRAISNGCHPKIEVHRREAGHGRSGILIACSGISRAIKIAPG